MPRPGAAPSAPSPRVRSTGAPLSARCGGRGRGGPPCAAALSSGAAGALYVADTNNKKIRLIDLDLLSVSTVLGSGTATQVDGTGTAATFFYPIGVSIAAGQLYVADYAKVRVADLSTTVVTTLAGNSVRGFTDGTGAAAAFKMIADVAAWRSSRDNARVQTALAHVRAAAVSNENIMEASIELAVAGGTTGEWSQVLRDVFGEFRAPTGVAAAVGRRTNALAAVADYVRTIPGGPPRFLVAKPGLDGHSSGAEQIAVAARDAGMEVVYSGIRLTPAQIAASARDEDPDVVGLSILSGSHMKLVPDVVARLRAEGCDAPVIVGGIIPEEDRAWLTSHGVAAVYTPKDFDIARIMQEVAELAAAHRN